jgi:hypothetical protein
LRHVVETPHWRICFGRARPSVRGIRGIVAVITRVEAQRGSPASTTAR